MRSKIGKNLAYNLGYQVLVLLLPLITSPYISRVVGADGLGIYSYVSSVAYYFLIVINLGLTNYGNRETALVRDNAEKRSRVFSSIQAMHTLIGIPILLIYIFCSLFVFETEYRLYFMIYGLYVLSAIFDINWFFFGMGDFKTSTIRNVIVKIATFVSMLVFVRKKEDLYIYVFIVAVSFLVSSLILWTRLRKYVHLVQVSRREIIAHIKPNLILFVPVLAMSVYRVMDKIMITWFSDATQTGFYQNADNIISMSMIGFSAISTVMLPEISNLVANNRMDVIKRSIRDVMQIGLALAVAITFGIAGIGVKFAPIFWGAEFVQSGYIMVGLAAVPIITEWKNVLRSQYLIPCGKDKGYATSLVIGACVNVVLNLIFIPKYAAMGAVIGTLAAEVAGAWYQTYIIKDELPYLGYIKDSLVFFIPGALMYLSLRLTINWYPNNFIGILFSIAQGAVVYCALGALFFRLLQKERFQYYVNFFLRKRR